MLSIDGVLTRTVADTAAILDVLAGYEVGAPVHRSRLRSVYPAVRLADGVPVVLKTLNAEYPSKQHVAELRREFADLTITAAEKVIRRSLDRTAQHDLIEQVLQEAPRPGAGGGASNN